MILGIVPLLPQAAAIFVAPNCTPAPASGAGGVVWKATFVIPPLPAGAIGVESVCWTNPAAGGFIGNSATPGVFVAGGLPRGCPNAPPAAIVAGAAPGGPLTNNQVGADWNVDCAQAGDVVVVSFACGNAVNPPGGVANCIAGAVNVAYVVSFPAPAQPQLLAGGGNVEQCNGPCTVGGNIVPIDKFSLVMPYIGLASVLGAVTALSAVYVKRVRRQKTNDD
jgi:hypothetical protein